MSSARDEEIKAAACMDCACSSTMPDTSASKKAMDKLSGGLLALFGAVLVTVVLLAVFAESLGLFDALKQMLPWPVWLVIVIAGGYPIFRAVLRANSRELKICKSGGCAKFYLPVSTMAAPQVDKWDELDMRGHLVRGESYPVFQASSVTNLGSIQ